MPSESLVSAIVHACADSPNSVIQNACAILGNEVSAATAAVSKLTGILSKESVVRLKRGLKGTETSSKELALALASTLAGLAAGRAMPDVELVWTGPDTPHPSPRDTLPRMLEMIGRADKSILLVTFAAFKAAPIMQAVLAAHNRGVDVALIVESVENSGGQLSHECWKAFPKALIEAGCLWVWPLAHRPKNRKGMPGKLHAKCLVIDESHLLVSSANLTDDAMERNIEIGLCCSSGRVAREMAENLRSLMVRGVFRKL